MRKLDGGQIDDPGRASRLERDRGFADSPLEQEGFEPLVSLAKKVTPASPGIRYDDPLLDQVSNATDRIRYGNLGVRPNRARRTTR